MIDIIFSSAEVIVLVVVILFFMFDSSDYDRIHNKNRRKP